MLLRCDVHLVALSTCVMSGKNRNAREITHVNQTLNSPDLMGIDIDSQYILKTSLDILLFFWYTYGSEHVHNSERSTILQSEKNALEFYVTHVNSTLRRRRSNSNSPMLMSLHINNNWTICSHQE